MFRARLAIAKKTKDSYSHKPTLLRRNNVKVQNLTLVDKISSTTRSITTSVFRFFSIYDYVCFGASKWFDFQHAFSLTWLYTLSKFHFELLSKTGSIQTSWRYPLWCGNHVWSKPPPPPLSPHSMCQGSGSCVFVRMHIVSHVGLSSSIPTGFWRDVQENDTSSYSRSIFIMTTLCMSAWIMILWQLAKNATPTHDAHIDEHVTPTMATPTILGVETSCFVAQG